MVVRPEMFYIRQNFLTITWAGQLLLLKKFIFKFHMKKQMALFFFKQCFVTIHSATCCYAILLTRWLLFKKEITQGIHSIFSVEKSWDISCFLQHYQSLLLIHKEFTIHLIVIPQNLCISVKDSLVQLLQECMYFESNVPK